MYTNHLAYYYYYQQFCRIFLEIFAPTFLIHQIITAPKKTSLKKKDQHEKREKRNERQNFLYNIFIFFLKVKSAAKKIYVINNKNTKKVKKSQKN